MTESPFALITDRNFNFMIQLNPTPTDFRGPQNFICYRWNSVITNIGNRRRQIEGKKQGICYRRNSAKSGFVRAGFNCGSLMSYTYLSRRIQSFSNWQGFWCLQVEWFSDHSRGRTDHFQIRSHWYPLAFRWWEPHPCCNFVRHLKQKTEILPLGIPLQIRLWQFELALL